MNPGWDISKTNFTDDDGSLPGIDFSGLSAGGLHSIVNHFFHSGVIEPVDATLYDNINERNLNLSEVNDPASLVITGTACPFHCCFTGLSWNDVDLPTLGLFVFSDGIEIDYRMGKEWSPSKVDAFFRLIAHLISLAPEAVVASANGEGLPYPDRFDEALNHYLP